MSQLLEDNHEGWQLPLNLIMELAFILPLTDDGDQMKKLQLRSIDSLVYYRGNGDKATSLCFDKWDEPF